MNGELKMEDKLDKIFKNQAELQKKYGLDITTQEFRNNCTLALIAEAMEALDETPWKYWKKNQSYNEDLFKKEIVDIWHFLIALSMSAGLTAEDVYTLYVNKNEENKKRHDEGY